MEEFGVRLFVAITLPEEMKQAIGLLQGELRSLGGGVRWVKPEGIHCTLKFLGEVDPVRAEEIAEGLSAGTVARQFRLEVKHLGVFPGWSRPRVIWTGIETRGKELQQVHSYIEQALRTFGFPLDNRPFRPHLTLGRVRKQEGLSALKEYCRERSKAINLGSFAAVSFSLYESRLRPEGAEYRVLGTYPLAGDDE